MSVSKAVAKAIARDAVQMEAKNQKILTSNLLEARKKLMENPDKWQHHTFGDLLDETMAEYEAAVVEEFPIEETIRHGQKEGQLFAGMDMGAPKGSNFWGWSPVLPSNAIALAESEFANTIGKATTDFKTTALRTVQQGLAMGAGTQDMMDDLLGVGLSGAKGKDGKFRQAVNRAEAIARTVSNDLINRGAMTTYGQIDRIAPELGLQKIWQTLSDNRTSDRCLSLSGQKRELNEPFQAGDGWTGRNPPAHPYCRARVTSRASNKNYSKDIDDRFAKMPPVTPPEPPSELLEEPLSQPLPTPKKAKKAATPKAIKVPAVAVSDDGFPGDLGSLKSVKKLGNNTELVEDANGKKFVRRNDGASKHELNKAYEAMGVKVPKSKLYGGVQLTEYIEGKTLNSLPEKERNTAKKKLNADFAKDALLGNKLEISDVLVDSNGDAIRVGGKPQKIDKYPIELFSLRGKRAGFKESMDQVNNIDDGSFDALPENQRELLKARLAEAKRTAGITKTLMDDKFNETYTENFAKHSLGIRKAGIVDRLPDEILLGENNSFQDKNGRPFDHLRGENNVVGDLQDYMGSEGLQYQVASQWMTQQSGNSWSSDSLGVKEIITRARGNKEEYFWLGDTKERAVAAFERRQELYDKYEESFAAYHAFTYEQMQKIDMPNNNKQNGTMKVIRVEPAPIVEKLGWKEGQVITDFKRGAAESSSMFSVAQGRGGFITTQEVPHHRILGTYLNARYGDSTDDAFWGDGQNEAVFIPDGIPMRYEGFGKGDHVNVVPSIKKQIEAPVRYATKYALPEEYEDDESLHGGGDDDDEWDY